MTENSWVSVSPLRFILYCKKCLGLILRPMYANGLREPCSCCMGCNLRQSGSSLSISRLRIWGNNANKSNKALVQHALPALLARTQANNESIGQKSLPTFGRTASCPVAGPASTWCVSTHSTKICQKLTQLRSRKSGGLFGIWQQRPSKPGHESSGFHTTGNVHIWHLGATSFAQKVSETLVISVITSIHMS